VGGLGEIAGGGRGVNGILVGRVEGCRGEIHLLKRGLYRKTGVKTKWGVYKPAGEEGALGGGGGDFGGTGG